MAAIQYYDEDDNPVSLDTLCRKEPEWAANRLREELKRIAELEAQVDALQNRVHLCAGYDRLRADRDRQKKSREHWIKQYGLAEDEADRLRAALEEAPHSEDCMERIEELEAERDSWRRVAERLEQEKIDLRAALETAAIRFETLLIQGITGTGMISTKVGGEECRTALNPDKEGK